jgi:ribonuclease HII
VKSGKRRRFAGTAHERSARDDGFRFPAGVDEAGRGCLAGPVVAAAVVLDPERPCPRVADSKLLSRRQREELAARILDRARSAAVAVVPNGEVDALNVHVAALRAMRQAVEGLQPPPDYVLADGFRIPSLELPQQALVGGDRECASIASASILAKVCRDGIMEAYDSLYPGFSFRSNKGYGTRKHFEALDRLGPTPIHRRSFRPVRERELPFGEMS